MAGVRHPADADDVGPHPRRVGRARDLQHRRRAGGGARTAAPGRHDRRRRADRLARSGRTARRHPTDRGRRPRVPAGPDARSAPTGQLLDRRDRVAHVDQRPHEPLPPRCHVGRSRPARARPGARRRARHALGTRVRPGALDHAAQPTPRRAHGRLRGVRRMAVLRVDLRSARATASRGVGRSTATTCASTRW